MPLVYAGSWLGFYRSQAWEHPTKTNSIPRQIPEQSWYTKSIYAVLLAGLIPFAVIFIELLFVFRSLWQDKSGYYYVFGFLSVVSLVLIVTVIEVTIVATYLQLCAEVSLFGSFGGTRMLTWIELPLVVAILLHRGRQCHLDLPVLRVVLLYEAQHPRLNLRDPLLQLQLAGVRSVRAPDGDGGLPHGICICQAYLRVSVVTWTEEEEASLMQTPTGRSKRTSDWHWAKSLGCGAIERGNDGLGALHIIPYTRNTKQFVASSFVEN